MVKNGNMWLRMNSSQGFPCLMLLLPLVKQPNLVNVYNNISDCKYNFV